MADVGASRVLLSLGEAARVTGRADSTLLRWLEAPLDEERADRFHQGETRSEGDGKGRRWQIRADALKRVHQARGGMTWQMERISAGNLPPAVIDELTYLRRRVAELERIVARRDATREQKPASHEGHETDESPVARELLDLLDLGKRPEPRRSAATQPLPAPLPTVVEGRQNGGDHGRRRGKDPTFYDRLPLPPGWVAVTTFAQKRDIFGMQFQQALAQDGFLPPPDRRKYRNGPNKIDNGVWTREQAIAAERILLRERLLKPTRVLLLSAEEVNEIMDASGQVVDSTWPDAGSEGE